MKQLFFLSWMFFGLAMNGQQKISFQYDEAGNQVERKYCESCAARTSNTSYKEVAALQNEDYQKFFENDVISYYPNPVKEFLHLKWELINDKKVKTIQLHTLSGQLQKEVLHLENTQSHSISFQNLPNGMYILSLLYTDGDQKTIKIVK